MDHMKTAAVIGCGKAAKGKEGWAIGHAHARGYLEAFPEVALYAVDIREENLASFGQAFGLSDDRLFRSTTDLFASLTPDAVSVCTWPKLHRPQVIEAAEAGVKAVTCEKPMALDGSEIDQMIQACVQAEARLSVAHQRRYDAAYIKARELLAEGAIGDKLVVQARVGDGWDILSWAVHWFDVAAFLLDDEPVSVLAGVDHTGTRRYDHAVEDASVIFVEYKKGHQAVFVTGPRDLPYGTSVHVTGQRGLLHFPGEGVRVLTDRGTVEHPVDDTVTGGFAGLFRDLWRNTTATDLDLTRHAQREAMATRLAFAAHESARTMRRIELPTSCPGYAPLEVAQHPPRRACSLGRVVLLADNHHTDPQTNKGGREGLRDALGALGAASVHVVPAEQREPTAGDLDGADLLIIYHTQRTSSEAVRALLGGWIEAGKSTVIAHCGIGAYPDWPRFRQWIGRYWVWGDEDLPPSRHPHEPCDLKVVEGSGFDPGFDSAWLPRDEVYMNLAVCAPVHELVTAYTPEGEAFIAWQAEGVPNVAVWAPGHRHDLWSLPVMHQGLRATIHHVKQSNALTASTTGSRGA
jgi:predicted dehydrogenase